MADSESTWPLLATDPTVGAMSQTVGMTRPPTGADGESSLGGRSTANDAGLQPLLRSRLIFIGIASLIAWTVYSLGVIGSVIGGSYAEDALSRCVTGTAIALIESVIVVLMIRDKAMPVRRLRLFELSVITMFVGMDVRDAITDAIGAKTEVVTAGTEFANSAILIWVIHVVFYGVLVPNSARRAAMVVGTIVAIGMISLIVTWSWLPVPPGLFARWAANLFSNLGAAGAFAVFNSARINAYRRDAASARKVGNYLLMRKLGGGGMGDVFLARHRLLKRPCAVKLIRAERACDPTFASRFEREVAATTRLNHPGAVQVYDYGRTDDGHFYYVMEYLPGLTLDEIVAADVALPPARVVHVLRQVCGALRAAHRLGMVHRDVKPGNIMVCRFEDRADVVKLLDFGLVSDAETAEDQRLTQVGGIVGTPAYMSPEQARGELGIGAGSDLYSLGAVGYFLLTGRPPFLGRGGLDVLNAHLTATVVRPTAIRQDIPPELESIVLRLLEKEPADRFASADELERALEKCGGLEVWSESDAVGWWERSTTEAGDSDGAPILTLSSMEVGVTTEAAVGMVGQLH
jgi:hypothetical protein